MVPLSERSPVAWNAKGGWRSGLGKCPRATSGDPRLSVIARCTRARQPPIAATLFQTAINDRGAVGAVQVVIRVVSIELNRLFTDFLCVSGAPCVCVCVRDSATPQDGRRRGASPTQTGRTSGVLHNSGCEVMKARCAPPFAEALAAATMVSTMSVVPLRSTKWLGKFGRGSLSPTPQRLRSSTACKISCINEPRAPPFPCQSQRLGQSCQGRATCRCRGAPEHGRLIQGWVATNRATTWAWVVAATAMSAWVGGWGNNTCLGGGC